MCGSTTRRSAARASRSRCPRSRRRAASRTRAAPLLDATRAAIRATRRRSRFFVFFAVSAVRRCRPRGWIRRIR
ncbi:hypothetical protein D8O27_13750 [Burkholderia mallei]|uniref:Uncharacterized protein n=1 Tax=Burkholderia mallei TaxID=13373 RepID=A0AAX1XCT1_BURML|nr:hypothetical protein CXQ84_24890 [Burkholderia pseudomallei]RKN97463.1 hypothetical protein D8O31_14675 [Burkholderia mallei]KAA8762144.1 hypothetical protein F5D26_33400 [Burkholderia pseudomallei]RKO00849.1 hypothetical protein D8O03_14710 [Burkholderia mallei]RKO04553.1 hypothetical protein D8O05_13540 [Burkholderia mallei]